MIPPVSSLNYETPLTPTLETWKEFYDAEIGSDPAMTYVNATYDMLQKIETIVLLDNFEEMKTKLTELYTERYDFVAHALKNYP